MVDLTLLAKQVHSQNVNVGWWDDWLQNKTDRHETAMMLVVSEIAEAMEGDRKNLMDDHLPKYKMFDVELADAMIRLLDLAGAYELEFERKRVDEGVHSWIRTFKRFQKSIPEQLYMLTQSVASVYYDQLEYVTDIPEGELVHQNTNDKKYRVYWSIVKLIAIAKLNNIYLWDIVEEKRAYNLKRADHKRKNRAAEGGKAY